MQWLKENIFIRIIIPFIAGIVVTYYIAIGIEWVALIVILCSAAFIIIPLLRAGIRFRFYYLYGISLMFLCVLCGYLLKYVSTDNNHYSYFGNYENKAGYFIGKVNDEPALEDRTSKIQIEVLAAYEAPGVWKKVTGRALLYIKKDSLSSAIEYGDVLLFRNNFTLIKRDRNPHAIDYKFILNNHNIFESAFTTNKDWALLEHSNGFDLYKEALSVRNACIAIINRNITDHESAMVGASLLLGYRGDMSNDLQNAYIVAGVIHILAVSGMQVGLLFLLLNFSLRWMERNPIMKWMKMLILLLAILFFTLITGLSGSVVRAAAMLSIIVWGRQMERHISIVNILFGSAFVLIVIQPAIIFDVGFELSFFAVWGILMLQKPIRSLFHTRNKFLDYCLNVNSVSLAAQAGTLPLILYYFHQFPVHFLLVNVVVIPVSSIILYGLIFLLGLSFIPPLAHLLGLLLQYSIILMDGFVRWVQHWPFALWYINHFDLTFLFLFFIVMAMFCVFAMERRVLYLNGALGLIVIMVLVSGIYNYYERERKKIVVFEHSKSLIFTCIDGNNAALFCSPDTDMEGSWFKKYLAQYFRAEGVRKVVVFNTGKEYQYNMGNISINGNITTLYDYSIRWIKNNLLLYSGNHELLIFPYRINTLNSITGKKQYVISEKGPLVIKF